MLNLDVDRWTIKKDTSSEKKLPTLDNFQQEDSKDLLKHINALDRYISLKSMNVMKQTTIDEFFDNS